MSHFRGVAFGPKLKISRSKFLFVPKRDEDKNFPRMKWLYKKTGKTYVIFSGQLPKMCRLYRHIRTHYGDMAYLKARTTPHACMKWECGYCGFYYRHEKFHQSKACNDNRKLAKEGCTNDFHDGAQL